MVERIADELAIRTLQQNYFHGVDSKDWDRFAGVLAEDAVFDFRAAVEPNLPPVRGKEAIVDFVRNSMAPITSAHHGFLRTLEFVGEDTARAVWAMEDILWTGERGSLAKFMHGYGHYHLEYRRIGAEWKMTEWKLTRTFIEQF